MNSRYEAMRKARAVRCFRLRKEGVSVKQTAELIGCDRSQVRALQVLGSRIFESGETSDFMEEENGQAT